MLVKVWLRIQTFCNIKIYSDSVPSMNRLDCKHVPMIQITSNLKIFLDKPTGEQKCSFSRVKRPIPFRIMDIV